MYIHDCSLRCNMVRYSPTPPFLLPILTDCSKSIASSNSITTLQFLDWNPNINGLCDNLQKGDYVCIGAPGGSYIPTSISNTSINANTQQPGGGDGNGVDGSSNSTPFPSNSTVTSNTTSSSPSDSSGSGSAAPSPTQEGISISCAKYSKASPGDFCSKFALKNDITPAELYALNGALGNVGQNCNTAFWSGYYYCVACSETPSVVGGNSAATVVAMSTVMSTVISTIDATPPSTTILEPVSTIMSTVMSTIISTIDAAPTSTTALDQISTPSAADAAAAASPSPTQPGIASLCAKFAQAHTGDTCSSFAAANGITPADLYSRNTALGDNGGDCETNFWGVYYYCVGGTD